MGGEQLAVGGRKDFPFLIFHLSWVIGLFIFEVQRRWHRF
jgi:hypothetical protein